MKKNIFKAVLAMVFIIAAIVSFNTEAKAIIKQDQDKTCDAISMEDINGNCYCLFDPEPDSGNTCSCC